MESCLLTPFGKYCRKLRIDNNEKMKDMAQKLGVTSSYLSAVETGKRNIPLKWIGIIAENYKLTENQVEEITDTLILDSLTEREKLALKEVVDVICLNDNSDYLNGLWSVVRVFLGSSILDNEGFSIKKIYDMLNHY